MSDDQLSGVVKQGVGHLEDGAGGLVGDTGLQAKGKVNEVAGKFEKTVGDAKAAAADVLEGAKSKVGGSLDQAQAAGSAVASKGLDVLNDVEDLVMKYPLQSLGAVFGLGVLIGMFLQRGHD